MRGVRSIPVLRLTLHRSYTPKASPKSIIPLISHIHHHTHNPWRSLTTLTPNEERAQEYLRKYGLGRGATTPSSPSTSPTETSQPPPSPLPPVQPSAPSPASVTTPVEKRIPKVTGVPLTISEIETLLDENGGTDIGVIDVRDKASFTDEIVIASGRSQRHVEAMAEMLVMEMKGRGVKVGGEVVRVYGGKKSGSGLLGIEEKDGWVIVDVGRVVVHCFTEDARDTYDLEGLWEQ